MDIRSKFLTTRKNQNTFEKPIDQALNWLKTHKAPGGGIVVHHKTKNASPEVTGYIIKTLYDYGENEFAFELANWEASIQRPDGSFLAPGDSVAYTFDTAQVIRGFLAVIDELPELKGNLIRACDFVENHISEKGGVLSPSYDAWKVWDGDYFTEYANLYVLPPLLQAGKKLNQEKYVNAAMRGMNYFRQKKDLVEFKPKLACFSHIFGYMVEALVELGETDLARRGLSQVLKIQKADGSIPAYPGAKWVCSTGIAQLAISLYLLGYQEPADKAVAYLERIQNASGGFYGSYGRDAKYFPKEEISWAVKYFLDASLLKNKKA